MPSTDQAQRLRDLVRRSQTARALPVEDAREQLPPAEQNHDLLAASRRQFAPAEAADEQAPALVLVCGGKGGVGTTTLAANLAVLLARRGLRVALLDADPHGGDVAAISGIEPRYTIADVLAGRKRLADALLRGPGDVHLLAGLWGLETATNLAPADGDHLLGQLGTLGERFDLVLVDAGNGTNRWLRGWWRAARAVVMIATVETTAVLDTYAALKCGVRQGLLTDAWLVVNRAPSFQAAKDVQLRLTQAAARFLGFRPRWLGYVPADPAVGRAADGHGLFVETHPDCPASQSLRHIGAELAAMVNSEDVPARPLRRSAAG